MQTANLASCSKSILTHNSSTATPLQTYTHHRGLITCTVWNKSKPIFNPDKSLASCGIDGKIILADKPGSIAFDVQFDLTKVVSVNSCAFSSNSRYIAAGGSDGLVKIWDMRRSEKEADLVLKSHIGAVTSVAWSRSDDIIASSSVSGDVVLNSVGNGDVVERFSCGK
jgi:WD40 repeat protein